MFARQESRRLDRRILPRTRNKVHRKIYSHDAGRFKHTSCGCYYWLGHYRNTAQQMAGEKALKICSYRRIFHSLATGEKVRPNANQSGIRIAGTSRKSRTFRLSRYFQTKTRAPESSLP